MDGKETARRIGRAARAAVAPHDRRSAALRLADHLPDHPLLSGVTPGNILVPTHHGDEIDTMPLAHRLEASGWTIHRPRVRGATLDAVRWPTRQPLVPGYRGIPEPPAEAPAADPTALDVVLVPGLAFAPDGARVGTGHGFFDRFLAPLRKEPRRPLLLGIAYRVQLLPFVPTATHDIPMDGLQLEDRAVVCRRPT